MTHPADPLAATNPKIQRLRRLIGRRSSREDEGTVVLEGPHAIEAVLGSGATPDEVFLGEDATPELRRIFAACPCPGHVVRAGVLEKVLSTTNPQPIAALMRWSPASLDEVVAVAKAGGAGPLLVLHEIRDPGNLGTILRAAVAAGASGVVLSERAVDPRNPKVVRASAGALFHIPVAVDQPIDAALARLGAAGMPVLGAVPQEGTAYDRADLSGAVALVVGNEGDGLPDAVLARCSARLTIPMTTAVESLNVAMAATVLLFESARQRRAR